MILRMKTLATTRFPTITPEALAELQGRLGKPVRRPEPYIEVATRDAIRHWAHGIGDRNPHWLSEGVAPPTILFALDRVVSGYVGGLPGIHAMYAGTDFRWERTIHVDDRIVGESVLHALVEKPSKFAKRAIQQIYRTDLHQPARRARVRGGLLVLPHRARDRARAGQVQVEGPASLLRRGDRGDQAQLCHRGPTRRGPAATGTT
jgi:hypothetical protein